MKLNNDKCDINECVESTAAAPPDTEHTGPHQDQATPAKSPTSKVPEDAAQPVIVWRSLMLQQ
jgi:hypothetical protein